MSLCLVESGVADRCVLVDTRVALIFDCAARHSIQLTEEALRLEKTRYMHKLNFVKRIKL